MKQGNEANSRGWDLVPQSEGVMGVHGSWDPMPLESRGRKIEEHPEEWMLVSSS